MGMRFKSGFMLMRRRTWAFAKISRAVILKSYGQGNKEQINFKKDLKTEVEIKWILVSLNILNIPGGRGPKTYNIAIKGPKGGQGLGP